ncbi:MAG: pyrroline-5-carboxylate reductase [Clostridia bacterium]|nr:pyrroline-5-carboxylate reductase [Clostridia bacterium]
MKIAVIGAGNMARAIIGSVKKSGRISPDVFCAYDTSETQLEEAAKLGAKTETILKSAISGADYVLISVKPQDIRTVIDQIKDQCDNYSSKKYISICAGISTDYICKSFGCDVAVIRVMPNAPILIGVGATAISRNSLVNDKDYSKICGIFAFGGEVASIPESQMNAIISVNSSSPAYFYEIIRIMIEYAKGEGIDENAARIMAQNAMLGAAKMLISSDKSPEELISVVKSKKGTTEAALDSLKRNGFEKVLFEAMSACTKRAVELGK